MQILVVMDGQADLDPASDSSLAIMEAARERGHGVRACPPHHLALDGPRLLAGAEPIEAFDVVLMRKDPPVDAAYVRATLLLDRAPEGTLVVNDPRSLRDCNEKLFALDFPQFMPPTVVTADRDALRTFAVMHGGCAVLKPLDSCGGAGVLRLALDDPNAGCLLDLATDGGRRAIMAQRYLPGVARGDKRVLLLGGRVLGAVLRVPAMGELRANLHVGGRPGGTRLTARERVICATVGRRCAALGLDFVGLDLIDGHLTEVNVTSPTGIRHIDALEDSCLGADVVRHLERRVALRRRPAAARSRATA